jgi:hypothetical protein
LRAHWPVRPKPLRVGLVQLAHGYTANSRLLEAVMRGQKSLPPTLP